MKIFLLLLLVLGCYFTSFWFILILIPFLLPVLFTQKIGEMKDGITWKKQNQIIKEKHNASKRGYYV